MPFGASSMTAKKKKKSDAYTFQLGKVPFTFLIVSLFIALILTFYIGYLVGQITAQETQIAHRAEDPQQDEPIDWSFYELRNGSSQPSPRIEPPPRKRTPKPPPEPGGDRGRFTVQVASVREVSRAQDLERRLKQRGYSAFVLKTDMKEKGVWYRVRVGRFETREGARTMAEKIEAYEKMDTLIVRNSQ